MFYSTNHLLEFRNKMQNNVSSSAHTTFIIQVLKEWLIALIYNNFPQLLYRNQRLKNKDGFRQ